MKTINGNHEKKASQKLRDGEVFRVAKIDTILMRTLKQLFIIKH